MLRRVARFRGETSCRRALGIGVMTKDACVSVIVPIHNEAHWLADCVESVLNQDYPSIELILVDDRSTDGSADLARRIAHESSNVLVASSTRTPGAAGTRNCGLENASGEVITYVDGDDLMAPGRIRAFVDYLHTHPECDVVIGDDELFLSPGTELPRSLLHRGPGHRNPYTMSMTHSYSLLDRVGGFDERFFGTEDADWVVRAKLSGCRVDLVDQVATLRRIHGSNATYEINQTPMRSMALAAKRQRAGLGHHVSLDTGTAPIPSE